jgi:TrmH family RNA methyltransferase
MPSPDDLDRIAVVLVRARNPSNIGAVARAMHDFGFPTLRVVNEFAPPLEAAKSAVDASDVIANAQSYATVADAVADCSLVIATTAVGERDLQHQLLALSAAAPAVRAALNHPSTRIALLFGSEKTGLSNDELSHCNWLLTIPMHEHEGVRHPSMNLGQAVAVCLYELVRDVSEPASQSAATQPARPDPVAAAQLERITALMTEVMQQTEYSRRHAHNCDPAQVRRLVRRIGVDAIDAPVWIGFLKQVLWKLSGGGD